MSLYENTYLENKLKEYLGLITFFCDNFVWNKNVKQSKFRDYNLNKSNKKKSIDTNNTFRKRFILIKKIYKI